MGFSREEGLADHIKRPVVGDPEDRLGSLYLLLVMKVLRDKELEPTISRIFT